MTQISELDLAFGSFVLGLAIAKATIGIHKGTIEVKSKPKQGSTFTIALPLA